MAAQRFLGFVSLGGFIGETCCYLAGVNWPPSECPLLICVLPSTSASGGLAGRRACQHDGAALFAPVKRGPTATTVASSDLLDRIRFSYRRLCVAPAGRLRMRSDHTAQSAIKSQLGWSIDQWQSAASIKRHWKNTARVVQGLVAARANAQTAIAAG